MAHDAFGDLDAWLQRNGGTVTFSPGPNGSTHVNAKAHHRRVTVAAGGSEDCLESALQEWERADERDSAALAGTLAAWERGV